MPPSRLALLLAVVILAAGLTVLGFRALPAPTLAVAVPLLLLLSLVLRWLLRDRS
ncbi:hypothetical protein [Frigidibacter sp. ROC022]|uniref:hypothetical protein n=1 Tax=Frigidibacter sp. ROC022 TaxID=2971796 RepID=UPI00215AEA82|nr:hypothetical protein [Frigidibacter sp. ROC022]MCR8726444.1 hypothetical protein [Frigidibacter sp. ROC022]